ncbi:hypothetical protein B0T19DRAFT_420224 [Cercophora scortea]|uniref:Uncharacterized protein n=1 Tax=Cercophora scortea TaxID=314031 RepID=A0AAE0J096_9PEZI|nr:hypothetical protein B0T19DRAFT_420224 [Cercophora scortea]
MVTLAQALQYNLRGRALHLPYLVIMSDKEKESHPNPSKRPDPDGDQHERPDAEEHSNYSNQSDSDADPTSQGHPTGKPWDRTKYSPNFLESEIFFLRVCEHNRDPVTREIDFSTMEREARVAAGSMKMRYDITRNHWEWIKEGIARGEIVALGSLLGCHGTRPCERARGSAAGTEIPHPDDMALRGGVLVETLASVAASVIVDGLSGSLDLEDSDVEDFEEDSDVEESDEEDQAV